MIRKQNWFVESLLCLPKFPVLFIFDTLTEKKKPEKRWSRRKGGSWNEKKSEIKKKTFWEKIFVKVRKKKWMKERNSSQI